MPWFYSPAARRVAWAADIINLPPEAEGWRDATWPDITGSIRDHHYSCRCIECPQKGPARRKLKISDAARYLALAASSAGLPSRSVAVLNNIANDLAGHTLVSSQEEVRKKHDIIRYTPSGKLSVWCGCESCNNRALVGIVRMRLERNR